MSSSTFFDLLLRIVCPPRPCIAYQQGSMPAYARIGDCYSLQPPAIAIRQARWLSEERGGEMGRK